MEDALSLVDGLDPLLLALVSFSVSLCISHHVLDLVLEYKDI